MQVVRTLKAMQLFGETMKTDLQEVVRPDCHPDIQVAWQALDRQLPCFIDVLLESVYLYELRTMLKVEILGENHLTEDRNVW